MKCTYADSFALVFALLWPTVVTVAYFVLLAGEPFGQAAYVVGKTTQFLFPLAWVVLVQRRWLRLTPPLSPRGRRVEGRGVGLGLAIGMVVAAGILALYYLLLKPADAFVGPAEAVRQKVVQLGLDTAGRFTAAAVFYSLAHSFLEEYYWRWFVYGQLREKMAMLAALVIASLGFMAHHVILLAVYLGIASPLTYVFAIGVAAGGVVWAWLYEKSGSLYGPWISHMFVDAAIFVIGYDMIAGNLG